MKTQLIWKTTPEITQHLQDKVQELERRNDYKENIIYFYQYLIHKIITHSTNKGIKADSPSYDGCPLNNETYLHPLFGRDVQKVSMIIRDLVKWDIIYLSKPARKNFNSNCYRINTDNFPVDKFQKIIITNDNQLAFLKRLMTDSKYNGIGSDNLSKATYKILMDYISVNQAGRDFISSKYGVEALQMFETLGLGIGSKKSLTTNSTVEKTTIYYSNVLLDRRDLTLVQVICKDFNCSRPDTKSRLYTNLTNLPREHRDYILLQGKPLMLTDISNSQIVLSIPQIKSMYRMMSGKSFTGYPEDFKRFQVLAESGLFYEVMGEACGKINMTYDERKDFKEMVFADIWFSKNSKRRTEIKDMFSNLFPNVSAMIFHIKNKPLKNGKDGEKDYAAFAIGLQRYEASIIVDNVYKKLLKQGMIALTLHDAIVVTSDEDLQVAEDLIVDALVADNIKPKFKQERNEIAGDQTTLTVEVSGKPVPTLHIAELADEETTYGIFTVSGTTIVVNDYNSLQSSYDTYSEAEADVLFNNIINKRDGTTYIKINEVQKYELYKMTGTDKIFATLKAA